MQDLERIEEQYSKVPQSMMVKFFTRLQNYKTDQSQLHIPTQFTQGTLDELIKSMLNKEETSKITFQFILEGRLLRGKLKSHIVRYELNCEQTLRIQYVLGFGKLKNTQSQEQNDWISCITEVLGVGGNHLAVGLYSGQLSIYNSKKQSVCTFKGDIDALMGVKVLPTSQINNYYVIYGGINQKLKIQIVDIQTKQEFLFTQQQHDGSILGIDINPNLNGLLCTVGSSGKIYIYQIPQEDEENYIRNKKKKIKLSANTAVEMGSKRIHDSSIETVCFMNSHQIITGSSDHSIGLIDVERLEVSRRFETKDSITSAVDCSANRILSSHEDGYLRMWDVREGMSPVQTFKSHSKYASCIKFHRNHNVFASGAYDHTVKIWDCRSIFPLHNIGSHLDKVFALEWNNQSELVSGGSDSNLCFHDFNAV